MSPGLKLFNTREKKANPYIHAAILGLVVVTTTLSGCKSGSSSESEAAMFQDGLALYNANAYGKAAAKFQEELGAYPTGDLADDAVFYLARSQYWLGDYPAAITGFTSIGTKYPNSNVLEASFYWKGKAEAKNNDFVAARASYQYILDEYVAARFTTDYVGDAHYGMAKSYYDAGDFVTAATEFAAAETAITAVSATDSKLDNVQYYLAKSYQQALNYTQAIAEYDLLIATYDGSTPEKTSGWVGNAKVQKGVIMMDQLDYAGAETYFINLLADPVFAASSDADLGQYTFAGLYYDQAKIEMALTVPDPLVYGPLLVKARAEYSKVITNYPTSSWADNAQYQIGKTYYDEADYANALTAFNTVVTNYAASSSADSAQYYIGRTLQKKAADAKALADAAATTGTPDYSGPDGFLALNASARSALQLTLTKYPQSSVADNAQYQIGKTYYDESDYATARAEFDKVISGYPASNYADNAQYYIGRAFHKESNTVDARAAYQLVLTTYPTGSKADGAQYYIARTYHDDNNCVSEATEMQTLVTNYPLSSHVPTAQTHLTDLLLNPPVTHTCI